MIGIGAGPATDGQVLVFHDLLGITRATRAKFVKRYAERPRARWSPASRDYAAEVRAARVPGARARLRVEPAELDGVPPLPRPGEPRRAVGGTGDGEPQLLEAVRRSSQGAARHMHSPSSRMLIADHRRGWLEPCPRFVLSHAA